MVMRETAGYVGTRITDDLNVKVKARDATSGKWRRGGVEGTGKERDAAHWYATE